ncbi:hypothetical protein G7054_g14485 [Neopestalotiopsis clavispora]|nr:hypothetical protein G7054_g14485 [Neopestalotiopsis clavispora]
MRFSTSIFTAVVCATAATAQLAGLNKLVADVTKLATDVASVPPNPSLVANDVIIIIGDLTAIAGGAGGLAGVGAGTSPAAGNAIVTQVVNTVCPALVTLENTIPALPFPVSLVVGLVTGALGTAVRAVLTSLRALPTGTAGVDISPAVTCLNTIVSNVKRDTVEPVPVAFTA